jgi:hypothetical protein
MKKLIPFLFFAFAMQQVSATHIIGGEMSYRCLGNGDYEITLKVYRDCYNGIAPFDSPTNVSIFNSSGTLVNTLQILFPGSDTLNVVTNCATVIPYVCAEQAIFIDTVNLALSAGGYTLVYQRCCRSSIIENILDPLNVGMTVSASIPDPSLATCNNSPVFINNPPFAFCVNVPINYDYSAVDPDGDSLIYELCNGISGADQINPYPNPPLAPPYADVVYVSPYSGTYPFNTNPPLAIDPQTGILTGTPASIGIFSLAVCVKEYRNGNLLDAHRRELAQVYSVSGGANPTAVEEISAGTFDVYPNPANNEITVDATRTQGNVKQVKLLDARGDEVKSFVYSSNKKIITIDIHDVNTGTYFLQLLTNEGAFFHSLTVMH